MQEIGRGRGGRGGYFFLFGNFLRPNFKKSLNREIKGIAYRFSEERRVAAAGGARIDLGARKTRAPRAGRHFAVALRFLAARGGGAFSLSSLPLSPPPSFSLPFPLSFVLACSVFLSPFSLPTLAPLPLFPFLPFCLRLRGCVPVFSSPPFPLSFSPFLFLPSRLPAIPLVSCFSLFPPPPYTSSPLLSWLIFLFLFPPSPFPFCLSPLSLSFSFLFLSCFPSFSFLFFSSSYLSLPFPSFS